MILKLYSLYDKKAQTYTTPQAFQNHAMALRYFSYMLNQPNNKYLVPDTELYYVADYDTFLGKVICLEDGIQFVSKFDEVVDE